MRAFFAVPPDPAWTDRAQDLVASLRPRLPKASWTRPESWHLTLTFLGEISEAAAAEFANALEAAVGRTICGRVPSAGPVLLPPRGRPRVLGVGFSPSPGLETLAGLARAADAAGRRIGVEPERREFRPHVTLARLREGWPPAAIETFLQEAGAFPFPEWSVGRCILYRSELQPAGAVHTPVREWELDASAAGVRA
jgi:RNA 2',3'-cyclic 3'-phosphodiesterase